MKVIVNEPKPVHPPKTYDLVGLSAEQAQVLRDIMGDMPSKNSVTVAIHDALKNHFPHRATPIGTYTSAV